MNPRPDNLIWIDLEMTGLDTTRDQIIEIAIVITDSQLNTIAEGPVFAIYQPDELLNNMDSWNTRQHTNSGLVTRVKNSTVSTAKAEEEMLDFVMQYVSPQKSPMCGSSICQDRRFLHRLMPALENYFHYRNLDVSSVKELAVRWYPHIMADYKKESRHLALSDIYDSINELRYYREHLFIK